MMLNIDQHLFITPNKKIGVPHRYVKPFYSPEGGARKITQLVRCLNEKELLENKKY